MSRNEDTCMIRQQLAAGAADDIVVEDDDWVGCNVGDVPGWTMLATREHVEGAHALSEAQAATLGGHVRRLGVAVTAATGADRVHVVYLGESSRHFHFGFSLGRPAKRACSATAACAPRPPSARTRRERVRS